MLRRLIPSAMSALCLFGAVTATATAQSLSKEPIRIVVGFSPGGPTDTIGRIAAEILHDKLGVTTVVENRAGASGAIGAANVAGAKPDGHTLLINVVADIVNPIINKEPDNLITKRFAPVVLLASAPNVLVVHPDVPVSTAKELAEYARSKDGNDTLSYASAGLATASHLAGVSFAGAASATMVHVPYKGTAAAQMDLLAGRVPVMFDSVISGLANAKAGKVKALAVTSPERWLGAPDLPTLEESGLPGTDIMSVYGVMAPADTPKEVIATISAALQEGLKSKDVRQRIVQTGAEPSGSGPDAYGDYLSEEVKRWQKLMDEGKLVTQQ